MDDLPQVRRTVDELKDRLSRARGGRAAKEAELKREFGVGSVREARRLLRKLVRDRERYAALYLEKKKELDRLLAEQKEQLDG